LSNEDFEGLRSAGLLGDLDWGIVPLRVVMHDRLTLQDLLVKSTSSSSSSSSLSPLAKEVNQLKAERSYLLTRLQTTSRQLERRAEGIKSYFENDIRKAALRNTRLQTQLAEARQACQLLESRHVETESLASASRDKAESKIHALESEVNELRMSVQAKKTDEISRYDAIIADEKARYSRLEMEHSLLQRESSKKDVRCKGLQRDVMRLQAAVAAAAEEAARREEKEEEEKKAIVTESVHNQGLVHALRSRCEQLEKELEDARKALELEKDERQRDREIELERRNMEASKTVDEDKKKAAFVSEVIPTLRSDSKYDNVAGGGGYDDLESIRQQMAIIRELPTSSQTQPDLVRTAGVGGQSIQSSTTSTTGYPQHHDVYAAHLTKLLLLAEEAIGKR
jgi:chromosome segregation ATPase